MNIEKDTVARFNYVLRNESGEELERSDAEPTACLIGHGNVLYALETAMMGKTDGEAFTVQLAPEQAYGLRKNDAVQRVPIKHLLGAGKKALRPGQAVKINTGQGPRDATVVKAGRFNVDVDTNHPLAGLALSFDIEIVDVRAATQEELSHRHAHGAGGHHH